MINEAKAWNPVWEEVFKNQVWGKCPAETLISFIARNFYKVPDRSQVNIIELGSGPGANLWYMAREGFTVTGVEGSPTAVEQSKARLETEGIYNVNVVNSDILLELDSYPENTFDAVVDAQCFSHINNEYMIQILAKCKKVLKPGGLLYSRTFSRDMLTDSIILDEDGNVKEAKLGGLAGKGFTRLSTPESIKELYGSRFEILTVDLLRMQEETSYFRHDNENKYGLLSEYVIVCKNNK